MVSERRAFVWMYGYDLIQVRSRDKYWKCVICDEKRLIKGLYKVAAINVAIKYLFKDYYIRESNKRKGYAEGEINSEDDNLMSGTATLFSATGTVYDQIVSGVKKHAKSTVIKSVFEQLKDVLILWIIAIQIALSTIENQQFRDLIVL